MDTCVLWKSPRSHPPFLSGPPGGLKLAIGPHLLSNFKSPPLYLCHVSQHIWDVWVHSFKSLFPSACGTFHTWYLDTTSFHNDRTRGKQWLWDSGKIFMGGGQRNIFVVESAIVCIMSLERHIVTISGFFQVFSIRLWQTLFFFFNLFLWIEKYLESTTFSLLFPTPFTHLLLSKSIYNVPYI